MRDLVFVHHSTKLVDCFDDVAVGVLLGRIVHHQRVFASLDLLTLIVLLDQPAWQRNAIKPICRRLLTSLLKC